MNTQNDTRSRMRLYDDNSRRLYVNGAERVRFLAAAEKAMPAARILCLTLLYTGSRLSEALEFTVDAVQPEARIITFRTLKRRRAAVFREVPVPRRLVDVYLASPMFLSGDPMARLWSRHGLPLHRATAYRWVKAVMTGARIEDAQACPKGLRHGYGIHAIRSGVQLNMLQKWMGHSSMTTTAIYANATGEDELAIADRMWDG